MAKATVRMTCGTCGDTYTAEKKCFNRREADNWEKYMSTKPGTCPSCYAKAQQEKRDAEREQKNTEAAAAAKDAGFPAMTGSEKQVAWAETLRIEIYNKIYRAGSKCTFGGEQITCENGKQVITAVNAYFETQTSAKVYIDNRNRTPQEWYDIIAKSAPEEEIEEVAEAAAEQTKAAITADIVKIAEEINEYDNPKCRYDVAIFEDGTVMRGDLHDDSNFSGWDRQRDHGEVVAELHLHPAYTTQDIRDDGQDDNDRETLAAWAEEAKYRIGQYAREVAEAIVKNMPTSDIVSINGRMWA